MTEEVTADWTRVILVCRDCAGRGWGPDGRMSLAKALRRELGVAKGPRASVGVVDSACLGVCPGQGVVALDAARPGRWLIARPGMEAAAVLAALGEPEPAAAVPAPAPTSLADWRALLRPAVDEGQA